MRDAIEIAELIESQAEGDEDFQVELLYRGCAEDGFIEKRAPAEDSHH